MKYKALLTALACASAMSVALASAPQSEPSKGATVQVDPHAVTLVKTVRKTTTHKTVKKTVTRRTHTHSTASSSSAKK